MNNLLHFVGNGYYTLDEFVAEGKRYGVQRRIQIRRLKRINFGDEVYLAFGHRKLKKDKSLKPAVVFGRFKVEKISGLSPTVVEEIKKRYEVTMDYEGGKTIRRKCGSYTTGPSFTVQATLEQIGEVIKQVDPQAKIFLSGPFAETTTFMIDDLPFSMISYIPFRSGMLAKVGDMSQFVQNPVIKNFEEYKTEPVTTDNYNGKVEIHMSYNKVNIYEVVKERKRKRG